MYYERDALLAEIARLYYLQDQSQQEIANQLDISRSNISRLLKEARQRGIVEIYVRHPLGRNSQLEEQLATRFGLSGVGVIQGLALNRPAPIDQAAMLATQLIDPFLANAQSLGISWGTAISAFAQAFAPQRHYDIEVIQMMGGVGASDPTIDGPAVAQRIAQGLTGRYRYLHAPLIVDTASTAQALLAERNIAETLSYAERVDIALVGIGAVEPSVSSLMRAGYLSAAEFHSIQEVGVVGDICARHFDIHGQPAAPEINSRIISVNLDKIAKIPLVIGIACGAPKARAILGALNGGYLHMLVTDSIAATAVLTLADSM